MNILPSSVGISGSAPTQFFSHANSNLPSDDTSTTLPPVFGTQEPDRLGEESVVDNNAVINNQNEDNPSSALNAEDNEETRATDESSVNSEDEDSLNTNPANLTEQELATLQKLKARDIEVRNHEQAHQAVGGQYASAPSYDFERGPDGKNYAVSGEVSIRLPSQADEPAQVIRHADQVIRAALAPAEPSAQDRRVAAQATQAKVEAQQRLREQQQEELSGNSEQAENGNAETENTDTSEASTAETNPRFAAFVDAANFSPSSLIGEIFSVRT